MSLTSQIKNSGFRFERIDEKSFNHFRGIKALSQIFSGIKIS